MVICVYGAASDKIDESYIKATEELGREMARRGHRLVFGGGGSGNMGAAARGVHEGGGHVTSVIPRFFKEEGIEKLFEEADETIYTYTLSERKDIMESTAEAFIVTPGGIGTFDEFFQVLTLIQLGQYDKPVALYNTNGYYDPMQLVMKTADRQGFLRYGTDKLYGIFEDPGQLVDYLEANSGKRVHER